MGPPKLRVGVVAIGNVPQIASKTIAAHILGYLNLDAELLPPLEHPVYAHDDRRLQYNASTILKTLGSSPIHKCTKVLGVLDVDIFVPIFTHVFGEAEQGGKCGVVSLYRLKEGLCRGGCPPDTPRLLERAAKVALHELGHLFDLFHCADNKCLMHFSGGLQDLDGVPFYFCRYCSLYFRDALHRESSRHQS
jgi:archaemetzincin